MYGIKILKIKCVLVRFSIIFFFSCNGTVLDKKQETRTTKIKLYVPYFVVVAIHFRVSFFSVILLLLCFVFRRHSFNLFVRLIYSIAVVFSYDHILLLYWGCAHVGWELLLKDKPILSYKKIKEKG